MIIYYRIELIYLLIPNSINSINKYLFYFDNIDLNVLKTRLNFNMIDCENKWWPSDCDVLFRPILICFGNWQANIEKNTHFHLPKQTSINPNDIHIHTYIKIWTTLRFGTPWMRLCFHFGAWSTWISAPTQISNIFTWV